MPTPEQPKQPFEALSEQGLDQSFLFEPLPLATVSTSEFAQVVSQNRRLHGLKLNTEVALFENHAVRYLSGLEPVVLVSSSDEHRSVQFSEPRLRDTLQLALQVRDNSAASLDWICSTLSEHTSARVIAQSWRTYQIALDTLGDSKPHTLTPQETKKIKYFDFELNRVKVLESAKFKYFMDGQLAGVASSSAENKECADIQVETLERFRGRGIAGELVKSWATHVLSQSKVPYYSHNATNTSSARVAEKLNLEFLFEDVRFFKLGNR